MKLTVIKKDEYENEFYKIIISTMANGLFESKEINSKKIANKIAEEYFSNILSQGIITSNSFIYSIENSSNTIGYIWYYIKQVGHKTIGRIALIFIKEKFRRNGFAVKAIKKIETELLNKGIILVELNVFSSNHSALHLYQKLGYVKDMLQSSNTRFLMVKEISC